MHCKHDADRDANNVEMDASQVLWSPCQPILLARRSGSSPLIVLASKFSLKHRTTRWSAHMLVCLPSLLTAAPAAPVAAFASCFEQNKHAAEIHVHVQRPYCL